MKKVDAEGKPIIHGRFYAYDPRHSWIGIQVGQIVWHRGLLAYLFVSNNPTFKPIVVNFQCHQNDWTTLVARDFVRFSTKRTAPAKSREEEMLEGMVVETWKKGKDVRPLMEVIELIQDKEVEVVPFLSTPD